MIPWFIVSLVARLVKPFGYQVVCLATVGRFGADRMYVRKVGTVAPFELRA